MISKNWGFGIMIIGIMTGFIGESMRFYSIWEYNPLIFDIGFVLLFIGICLSILGENRQKLTTSEGEKQ